MKKIIAFCIVVTLLIGCGGGGNQVDKAISQVNKSIDKIEKSKGKMTEADWKALEKEVEAPLKVLSDALESNKVGALTKIKIVAATTRWATVAMQAGLKEVEKQLGTDLQNLGKEMEKATKDIDLEGLGKELEKAAKELQKAAGEQAGSESAPAAEPK